MVERIQLTKDTYMNLGGGWRIVLGGSVIDVADASKYRGACTVLNETPGALAQPTKGHPTAVRNVRSR